MLRGIKVGEVFDAAEDLRRGGLGRAGRAAATCSRCDGCRSSCRLAVTRRCGGRRRARDADAERDHARRRSRRIDITCNVRGPRSRRGGPRDRGRACAASRSTPAITPSSSASTRREPHRSGDCSRLGVVSLVGILLVLHVDFGSVRMVGARCLDDSLRADRRRRQRVPHRRRAVAGIAGRLRHGARHRRAQRHHAGQPLPAPRSTRSRPFGRELVDARAPRSGWRRS